MSTISRMPSQSRSSRRTHCRVLLFSFSRTQTIEEQNYGKEVAMPGKDGTGPDGNGPKQQNPGVPGPGRGQGQGPPESQIPRGRGRGQGQGPPGSQVPRGRGRKNRGQFCPWRDPRMDEPKVETDADDADMETDADAGTEDQAGLE